MDLKFLNSYQIKSYFDEGYIVIKGLFDAAEVRKMNEAFERLMQKGLDLPEGVHQKEGSEFAIELLNNNVKGVKKVSRCGASEAELLIFGGDQRLLKMAHDILESDKFEQSVNQAEYKLPHDLIQSIWYQDSLHRRYGSDERTLVNSKGSYVQMITILDEMTKETGSIQLYRESNKFGHINVKKEDNFLIPDEYFVSSKKITLNLSAGDTVLIHPFTIHGSLPNSSSQTRRLFINGFAIPRTNHL